MANKIPLHLKHKPIFSVNYEKVDQENDRPGDAKFLSLGQAQWDNDDISVKVFRKTPNGNWSRQSEELPLSRVLDMAILIADTYRRTDQIEEYWKGKVKRNGNEVQLYEFFEDNKKMFNRQLDELKKILNK